MNFNRKDVIIGFVIILVVLLGSYFYRKTRLPKNIPTPMPVSVSFQKDFEEDFKLDIPDDANTVELKDVSGGSSRGIATENEILVDADSPKEGYFYEAWLVKDGTTVSIGKLFEAKGGWILEYDKSMSLDVDKVIVSEEKYQDSTLEKKILEGSFN